MPANTDENSVDTGTATLAMSESPFVPSTAPVLQAVERSLGDIAATEVPVLILGESGTGKGAFALRIHQLSRHRDERIVKMSCGSLTGETFNGHGWGSKGELSPSPWTQSGTVFLDEIADLDQCCQSRLLQVLPDGEMQPGGYRARMRVISCTRRELEREVRARRFREDLYYRISGVCLRLPPLRQRKEDIPVLVEHFLTKYATLLGRSKPEISPATLRRLMDYSWPGNIRELDYSIQKIIALGSENAALADLRSNSTGRTFAGERLSLKEAAREASRQAERELILKVLTRTRWNRKRAAQELQISYKALLYKLKQMGLEPTGL